VKTETPPIRATAKIRRVESLLPDARQDIVAASAMAIKRTAGMIQSAPHNRPISTAIGTWSQSTTSNALLVVSRNVARSSLSIVIPNPQGENSVQKLCYEKQAAIARGSTINQTPAWRNRTSPSRSSGRTTRSDGMAVVRTMEALADAALSMTCWTPHHGGKATATTSVPGRACSNIAAIAIQLAISNAAAFSQQGHRDIGIVFARSIGRQ